MTTRTFTYSLLTLCVVFIVAAVALDAGVFDGIYLWAVGR